ncbi:MAG: hypothetical protein HRU32_07945 [Rhodobacteraceae bacterium]|nr:hypothetical protein [Paracoccaceae bacterium]
MDLYLALRYPREVRRLRAPAKRCNDTRSTIAAPLSANFKFAWRKLIDHDPRFKVVTDKLAAKAFVEELKIPAKTPKTLWVGAPDAIPDIYLTSDVVIKTNHGWGSSIFPVRDGLSPTEVRKGIDAAMAQRHGRASHQWSYFNIKPKLFVEERIGTEQPLVELKLYTYGAQVRRIIPIRTLENRKRIAAVWLPDEAGKLYRTDQKTAVSPDAVDQSPLPECVGKAIDIAGAVGSYFDHMRVDFLTAGSDVFLGEITVYSQGGYLVGGSSLGSVPSRSWDLRRSWFLNASHRGWRKHYARALRRFYQSHTQDSPSLNAPDPLCAGKFANSMAVADRLLAAER